MKPIREQLTASGRVRSMAGGPLYVDQIADHAFQLRHARNHASVTIDAMMPARLVAELSDALKGKWGRQFGATTSYEENQLFAQFTREPPINVLLPDMRCRVFDLLEAGVELATFELETENDAIWFPDWSDIQIDIDAAITARAVKVFNTDRHLIIEDVGIICGGPV